MVAKLLLILAVAVSATSGFLFGGPDWNGLKVTWGVNPFGSAFAAMPRTESEAIRKGWTRLSPFSETGNCGSRYMLGDDFAVVLIYDRNGYIAGIQTGIPNNLPNFPPNPVKKFYQEDSARSKNFITAYFVDPQIICGRGRTEAEYNDQGTGTMLAIQNGASTFDVMTIAMDESDMPQNDWVHGQCFWTMGEHYWASTTGNAFTADMSCDTFYPMFLLYNGDKLNGFGWAFMADITSDRFEHPTSSVLDKFLPSPVPTCLTTQPTFTTLHIYMTNSPSTNFC